jgi:hypothetical protein
MTDDEDKKIIDALTHLICASPHLPSVVLELEQWDAWILLGQLQLALRHPANKGNVREVAEAVARLVQQQLILSPLLKELVEKGWDAVNDQ